MGAENKKLTTPRKQRLIRCPGAPKVSKQSKRVINGKDLFGINMKPKRLNFDAIESGDE